MTTPPPYQQPYQPPHVVTTKRGANHTFHLIMSILTAGLWAITVWPIAALMGRKTTTVIPAQPQPWAVAPPQHGWAPQLPPGQYPPQTPPPGPGWTQQGQ